MVSRGLLDETSHAVLGRSRENSWVSCPKYGYFDL